MVKEIIKRALTKEKEGNTREALLIIYSEFRRLIIEERLEELDNEISVISMKEITIDIGLAVLTASLPRKTKSRKKFFNEFSKKFQERGLLDGLS